MERLYKGCYLPLLYYKSVSHLDLDMGVSLYNINGCVDKAHMSSSKAHSRPLIQAPALPGDQLVDALGEGTAQDFNTLKFQTIRNLYDII